MRCRLSLRVLLGMLMSDSHHRCRANARIWMCISSSMLRPLWKEWPILFDSDFSIVNQADCKWMLFKRDTIAKVDGRTSWNSASVSPHLNSIPDSHESPVQPILCALQITLFAAAHHGLPWKWIYNSTKSSKRTVFPGSYGSCSPEFPGFQSFNLLGGAV